jgi:formylglycine-generating enzyme required for sulfatase activity
MNKLQKSAIIGVGALLLSTVAIQASDLVRGIEGNLSGLVSESTSLCGDGATQILLGSHSLCMDLYEASASVNCPHPNPEGPVQTQENANDNDCVPESKSEVIPWRFVSLTQAQQLCARAGKRLPTNEEWYKTVSGLADQSACVVSSDAQAPAETGTLACVTPSGIYDMVGNVWEWIDGEIVTGSYNNRQLPPSGYVSLVDSDGVVIETTQAEGLEEFGKDYAQTSAEGVKGMVRGGFYGSEEDAGIFAQNLSVPLDLRSAGIGFRCVKDL